MKLKSKEEKATETYISVEKCWAIAHAAESED